jgi:hypothetical protein
LARRPVGSEARRPIEQVVDRRRNQLDVTDLLSMLSATAGVVDSRAAARRFASPQLGSDCSNLGLDLIDLKRNLTSAAAKTGALPHPRSKAL